MLESGRTRVTDQETLVGQEREDRLQIAGHCLGTKLIVEVKGDRGTCAGHLRA